MPIILGVLPKDRGPRVATKNVTSEIPSERTGEDFIGFLPGVAVNPISSGNERSSSHGKSLCCIQSPRWLGQLGTLSHRWWLAGPETGKTRQRAHAHIHVAEGEAIRSATRATLLALDIDFVEQDEKSILPDASRSMGCSQEDCDEFMKSVKPAEMRSWRKEERIIALGAWLRKQ